LEYVSTGDNLGVNKAMDGFKLRTFGSLLSLQETSVRRIAAPRKTKIALELPSSAPMINAAMGLKIHC